MLEKPYLFGVDPGIEGAIAVFDLRKNDLVTLFDVPVIEFKDKKSRIDLEKLSFFLDIYRDQVLAAIIEEVNSAPDQGVASTFRFGFASGVLSGAISASGTPINYVRPAAWKPMLGLSRDKKDSLKKCRERFKNHGCFFKRRKDHNRAEAALLAALGARFVYQGIKNAGSV